MSNRVADYRRALRHEILCAYPGFYLNKIAQQIKSPDSKRIYLSDLHRFCESGQIPISSLPAIFSSYKVFIGRMSEQKFVEFLRDEVTCRHDEPPLNPALTDNQATLLTQFVAIVKSRKTRDYMPQVREKAGSPTLSGERYALSSTWSTLMRMSTGQGSEKYIRVATLCRIAAEIELQTTTEAFIDALFAFYGRRLDQITFDEFAQLMEAFA
jgi:hypothetical protein